MDIKINNVNGDYRYKKAAGFIKEGLLRDSSKNGDEYWSLWEMSILEDEWMKTKNV